MRNPGAILFALLLAVTALAEVPAAPQAPRRLDAREAEVTVGSLVRLRENSDVPLFDYSFATLRSMSAS